MLKVENRDSKKGCVDSEVDDTTSSCNGRAIDFHMLCKENSNKKELITCKACAVNDTCTLLLPCRHLCLLLRPPSRTLKTTLNHCFHPTLWKRLIGSVATGNPTPVKRQSSSVKLENISKSYKGVTVLKDVSWEVKKGEKVGLVEVNEAGKTIQMRIIAGLEEPDSGNVIKAKPHMKNCVLEPGIRGTTEDLELMGRLLDEFNLLQRRAQAVDLDEVDAKASKLMSELGFSLEDSDRLVASFSSSWQMRMSLGKILLQEPDFLLLDEPTSHLDLDIIEWLEGYLNKQDVPMVIISHDRAFLDQLCTKIVETDMGVPRTFEGNYSQYVEANASWLNLNAGRCNRRRLSRQKI
ncbi:ABC transporter F family member 5 [Hibiscus syriacus]|uniref:ABC transporter F family member 5 n=1 Tax=Hibiscus syriacus TaxID=106335 RepID=A0A6A2XFD2_HIBSY|nr:ABC transporter F family member 5 [Hibiscus syriacus]